MKVSVIVPTYRRGNVLFNALESLAAQTFKDFEIIIIDDNDNLEWNSKVERIVSDFKSAHAGITVNYIQNHPNKGSAGSRNTGIEIACGEYITFLDDDDVYLPEKIEHQIAVMEAENSDYSLTDLFLFNESEKLIDKRIRSYIEKNDSEFLFKYHMMHHMTGTDTMMFKKEYLTKIGGFPPIDVGDEFYLMSNAITGGGKFSYIAGCNVKAYVHTGDGGLSSGQSKVDGENALYEYKKAFFEKLDKKTVRYIKMRHHAVLAFAYLRTRKYIKFIVEGLKAFIYNPKECFALLKNRG